MDRLTAKYNKRAANLGTMSDDEIVSTSNDIAKDAKEAQKNLKYFDTAANRKKLTSSEKENIRKKNKELSNAIDNFIEQCTKREMEKNTQTQ